MPTRVLCGLAFQHQVDDLHRLGYWLPCALAKDQRDLDTVILINTDTDQVDSTFTVSAWEPLALPGGPELFLPRISFHDELIQKSPVPHRLQARANELALGCPDAESCIPAIELHTHTLDFLIEIEETRAQEYVIRECAQAAQDNRNRPEWDRLTRVAESLARVG